MSSMTAVRPAGKQRTDAKVRVMVVDDSVVIRGLVSRWLAEDGQIEVVAKCANGATATDQVAAANPHVIILDIEMPVMDGLTALPKLLAACPAARVIVASTLTKRNAAISLKALSLGAVECIPKPQGNSGISTSLDFRNELLAKVRGLGGLELRRAGDRPGSTDRPQSNSAFHASAPVRRRGDVVLKPYKAVMPRVVAIGSSTGGPQALAKVLSSLGDATARIPCFITQHMPPTFTAMLAENLSRSSGLTCVEALEGDVARAGHVYVAPGGKHLIVKREGMKYVCHLDDGPPVNFTKPCVDLMIDSIVECYGAGVLAVILTGMGADGVRSAVNVRNAGGNVIVQDQATSVVWGMPGATAHTGECSAILPVDRIGPEIARVCRGALR